jgi:hypothetical protein
MRDAIKWLAFLAGGYLLYRLFFAASSATPSNTTGAASGSAPAPSKAPPAAIPPLTAKAGSLAALSAPQVTPGALPAAPAHGGDVAGAISDSGQEGGASFINRIEGGQLVLAERYLTPDEYDWFELDRGPQVVSDGTPAGDAARAVAFQQRADMYWRQLHVPAQRFWLSDIDSNLRSLFQGAFLQGIYQPSPQARPIYRNQNAADEAAYRAHVGVWAGFGLKALLDAVDVFTAGAGSALATQVAKSLETALNQALKITIGTTDIASAVAAEQQRAPVLPTDPTQLATIQAIFGPVMSTLPLDPTGAPLTSPFAAPDGSIYFRRQGLLYGGGLPWYSQQLGEVNDHEQGLCSEGDAWLRRVAPDLEWPDPGRQQNFDGSPAVEPPAGYWVPGRLRSRVNARAPYYRLGDVVACKTVPFEIQEVVNGANGPTTIYYQPPGLHCYYSPTWGIVAGSIFAPTPEDLPIPGHSQTRAQALARVAPTALKPSPAQTLAPKVSSSLLSLVRG